MNLSGLQGPVASRYVVKTMGFEYSVFRVKKPAAKRDRKLAFSVTLKDCDVQTFQSGGPGGQHQNHSNTGVRIVHRESGAVGESREQRSQLQNKQAAWKRMCEHPKFKIWVNRKLYFQGEAPEERVEKDMQPDNLKVEVRDDGKWVTEDETGGSARPPR
jgi:hypothetical protein